MLKKTRQSSKTDISDFKVWQNVSNEVLVVLLKFHSKITSRSGVCFQGKEENISSLPSAL